MIYVACVEAVALVLVVVSFAGLLRSQQRAHARREDLLVNQLCAVAGHPWQTPPATEAAAATAAASPAREPGRFTPSPEQFAV